MNEEYIDIQVYNGDNGTRYIKYEDMINLIEKIKIKQEEKDKEIERLNNIIKEVREYIESYNLPKDLGVLGEAPISISELKHILEILDKGE